MRRVLLPALLFLAAACSREPAPYRQESYVFGTRVEISVAGLPEARAKPAVAAVLADLDALNSRLHAWQAGSEVMALNAAFAAGKAATVAPDVQALLRRGQYYETASGGLFSPAIGQLIGLWGFHADSYMPVSPEPARIKALLAARPAMSDLVFDGAKVSSRNTALVLDLGGIAKGWALDRARTRLQGAGVTSALINIGGNVMALGSKPDGEPWRVGIQHPRKNEALAMVELADGEAIGTSGDYQRYFELNGQRHCHLIDPRDGNTDCRMQAATVIAPAGPEAGLVSDVASKPLYLAGPTHAAAYARRMGVRDILLLDEAGRAWISPSLSQRLHWLTKPQQITLLE
ncbi:FAD:protein FMN transferase [Craterilacuibacter sp.]|uniref:FAD:protein FMN transferase n=1 Tax=Craterilacuibacter sp. TaxID=2870909 RepID=UPI003F2C07A5